MRIKHVVIITLYIYAAISAVGGYFLNWFEPFCEVCDTVGLFGTLGIMVGFVLVIFPAFLYIAINWDKKIL